MAHGNNLLSLMPVTSLDSTIDEWITVLVHIRKDSVLVREASVEPLLCHLSKHCRALANQAAPQNRRNLHLL